MSNPAHIEPAARNTTVLTREEAAALEQKTMMVSVYAVCLGIAASLIFGFSAKSDTLLLSSIFFLLNLASSGLGLLAAKLVNRPADKDFQYGYWYIEPLVNSFNGLMMIVVCVYGFINGLEGLRTGGHTVDSTSVIWFSVASALFCAGMVIYKTHISRKIKSKLLKSDTGKWVIKFAFSVTTLFGFVMVYVLNEPYYAIWQRYVDSFMAAVLSLLLLPIPLRIMRINLRELLHMAAADTDIQKLVDHELDRIKTEYRVLSHNSHVIQIGRSNFVEVNILVAPDFELQTIVEQDLLRERIWNAIHKPLVQNRLAVFITSDTRWEDGRKP